MRLPGFDRVPARKNHARVVIRMNSAAGGPTFQSLKGLAEIIQDFLIEAKALFS